MISSDKTALRRFLPELSLVFWLWIIAFSVRLLALSRFSNSPYFLPDGGDMKFYSDWALQVAKGHFTDGKAFYGLPGYAFLLAGIYRVAGFDPFIVGLLQSVSEAFIATIIYKIAALIFETQEDGTRGRWIGCLGALGWIFFQPAQTFSIVLMPTTWLVLAFWGTVYWIIKTKTASCWNPWIGMGLIIGGISMIVATILFLVPLAVASIIFNVGSGRAFWKRVSLMAVAVATLMTGVYLGAAPCWIHNYFIAGEPVMLSAHSGLNFYIGNNPIATGYPKIPPGMRAGQQGMLKDSITMAEVAAGHPLKRVEVSKFWASKASAYIHGHFGDWLRLMGIKLRNFWNAYQYDDLSLITLFAQDGILTPGLRFGFVAALALPGMILGAWTCRRSRWVVAAVLLHMAALLPVFITERYRLAAVPGLLLMGAYGLYACRQWLADGRWRPACAYIAASCAATYFVSLPNKDGSLYALDYYNTGIKATEAGNLARAENNLNIAIRYVPDNAEFNFALGNLWLKKGDRTRAKQFYRRAIELDPRHASAFNNLGVLAMEEKRWPLAEKFLKASLLTEPDDAKTIYLLARVDLELHHCPLAGELIKEALKINPTQREFLDLQKEIESRRQASP